MAVELLTTKEITKLEHEGYSLQFVGKKTVEYEGSNLTDIFYHVDVNP